MDYKIMKKALLIYLLSSVFINGVSATTLGGGAKNKSSVKQPNVVFVITDDQGYGDLSIHGNPIVKTPHIDAFAKESVSLTNYHVAPTCSPTRAALLTGHWTNRTGVWHTIMGRSMLRKNEITIADLLKSNGYHTAMFGKWHLGDNYPYRPNDRGFEHAYYHGGGGVGQTPDHWNNAYFDGSYMRNGVQEPAKGFVTDVLFSEAIDYIESVKDSEKPFFTYISTNAPHGPMHAPKKYADMYADKKIPEKIQHFFGMITNIDDNVAKLRTYLKDNNLADNTIFIFTTDNGTSVGDKVYNSGMRGHKGSAYEGGHRVPFFIHWPAGNIDQEKQQNTITSYVDVVPTLLDFTSSKVPQNLVFDGRSIRSLIEIDTSSHAKNKHWPDRIIITDSQRVLNPIKWRKSSVMTDKWRLINGEELYDMTKDPGQESNIAKSHPDVVEKLRTFYHNWWQEIAPTFAEPTSIPLGFEQAKTVKLTSHDWLGGNAKTPWQQGQIRESLQEKDGIHKGFWAIDVVAAGQYQFKLSRWPMEANTPIVNSLPAGGEVAGDKAFRARKGVAFNAVNANISIAGKSKTIVVTPTDIQVAFELELPVGKTKLMATFIDENSNELGAYYVQVEKIK